MNVYVETNFFLELVLNRNSRDFDVPNILQELTQYNCRMIPLFDQGYQFIYKRVTSDDIN